MASDEIRILILGDGKPGHENQSLGLAEAMARLCPASIAMVKVAGFFGTMKRIADEVRNSGQPDYLIGAGHSTHLPLLRAARKYETLSIVMMKPSLPAPWFDWCVTPKHDFLRASPGKNVILTKGAPNRVVPSTGERNGRLALIGGPSKIHAWDGGALALQIAELAKIGPLDVADSRRTPEGFLAKLSEMNPAIAVFPHQKTAPGWLAEKLAETEEIHVTEDSVSMIYEALSSGARVGVLEMPRKTEDSRLLRGLEQLQQEGYFIGNGLNAPPVLAEADRCARLILGGG